MLPNEAVRLTIGTKTQQLDVVTARVAVEECIVAVNEFLAQHPVSPTKYEVACCGSYAEYEVQEGPTRNDMLNTLPESVRPPGAYVSKMKVHQTKGESSSHPLSAATCHYWARQTHMGGLGARNLQKTE